MNSRQLLTVQSLKQQNILRGNGIDIHKLIEKLPRPKRGWVLPGYRYCGPFNPLEEQVDEDGNARSGSEPVNDLDDVCRIHDNMYGKAKNSKDKHKADKEMLTRLKKVKPKTVGEKLNKKLVQGVIGTKYQLGLSIKQQKIIDDLF